MTADKITGKSGGRRRSRSLVEFGTDGDEHNRSIDRSIDWVDSVLVARCLTFVVLQGLLAFVEILC